MSLHCMYVCMYVCVTYCPPTLKDGRGVGMALGEDVRVKVGTVLDGLMVTAKEGLIVGPVEEGFKVGTTYRHTKLKLKSKVHLNIAATL